MGGFSIFLKTKRALNLIKGQFNTLLKAVQKSNKTKN